MALVISDSEKIRKIMDILGLDRELTVGFALEVMADAIPIMTVTQYVEKEDKSAPME